MRKRLLAMLIIFLFINSIFTVVNGEGEREIKNGKISAAIICKSNVCTVATLQPTVIITQPADGAVFNTRDVTVLGYASDENGMNYWEWEWHWQGGSYSNSSYFETANYVEFRIDIHGLALGWNLIIVRFRNVYGSMGEDAVNITYEDIYPPNIDIVDPPDGSVFTEPNIVVKVRADDGYGTPQWGSGVKEITWVHKWDDGEEENSHVFDKPYDIVTLNIPITLRLGNNTIEVTATDAAGNIAYPDTVVVTLIEELIADANGPYYGGVNETIQFKGNASGGKPPYQWQWDFGDGATSNEQNPEHVYSNEGNYTIKLIVIDSLGNIANDTTYAVISEKLFADAGGPYYGKVNEEIQFNGLASGGKPPYQWQWDFGDGATSNEQNPKHAYTKEGKYVAKLTVTDSEGNTANDTAQVTIYKELKADADGPYGGKINQVIQFNGFASGGVPPYQWRWDFGDGSFSNQQNPVHSYSKEGIYTATLTVKDSIGNTASDIAYVYVYTEDNQAPFVKITKPENALYINDKKVIPLPFEKTVIIGDITIEVNASDNIGIAKVEFYIDSELKHINSTYPYFWLWNETSIGKHEIKVIAYDFDGNIAIDEKKVWIINI